MPVDVLHAPVVQSVSAVQVVLHVVASAQISEPGHGVATPGTHESVVPEQWPMATVFAPEQPLVPQVAAAGFGEQVPSRPATAHEPQSAVHALLQHTPSAQKPLVHSAPVPHVCPSALPPTHLVALQ
jgi:hypothetical protein